MAMDDLQICEEKWPKVQQPYTCLIETQQEFPPVQYHTLGFLWRQQCEETQTQEGEERAAGTERSHRNCFLRRLCSIIMIAPTFIPEIMC